MTGSARFQSLAELVTQNAGTYCMPWSSSERAVDSVLTPQTLFQITVSERHAPVNAADMDEAMQVFPLCVGLSESALQALQASRSVCKGHASSFLGMVLLCR